jgi:hypothetical protein
LTWRGLALGLALSAPGAAFAQTLTVVGPDGLAKTLAAADLADLPRAEVSVTAADTKTVYEGPVLSYVLRAAGLPVGQRLHGEPLRDYLVVSGQDGFFAVYSLAEVDKDFRGDVVILADKAGGQPLPAKQQPWRIVSSGDLKSWRSVYAVTRIEVKQVAPAKP